MITIIVLVIITIIVIVTLYHSCKTPNSNRSSHGQIVRGTRTPERGATNAVTGKAYLHIGLILGVILRVILGIILGVILGLYWASGKCFV